MSFSDPGASLQRAVIAALKANVGVTAIVGTSVFDRVPRQAGGDANAAFPYVSLGETQTLPETGEATDAAEIFLTVHAWSRAVGTLEVKALNAAVAAALHDADLPLPSGVVQSLLLQDSRVLPDPDGLTSHGVMTFHILTDAT